MAIVILLIGPSGVGKSTVSKLAQMEIKGFSLLNLDSEVMKRSGARSVMQLFNELAPEKFLECCKSTVKELERQCSEDICLIDVGAGALEAGQKSLDWVKSHKSIIMTASIQELHKRDKLHRQHSEYSMIEFSARRVEIYDSGTVKLDLTGKTKKESVAMFIGLLKGFKLFRGV